MADFQPVADVYLQSRLASLLAWQNTDGGWGYFPGKKSWLEPTAYAVLALQGSASAEPALQRACNLIQSLRLPDGSYRPGSSVEDGTWATALAVTIASVRGTFDDSTRGSVDWLLGVHGLEGSIFLRAASLVHLFHIHVDVSHEGWPWRPGNSAWIEPTAHTLIALKKAAPLCNTSRLRRRVRDGEEMILTRRCSDGGWNYGTPSVFNYDLPSYGDTTGLALLGLLGRDPKDLAGPMQAARRLQTNTRSPFSSAWLAIALRNCGVDLAAPDDHGRRGTDVALTALEALGHPSGNFRLLGRGVHS